MSSAEEQIRREAELAKRLKAATKLERPQLYGPVYDEIYGMHMQRNPGVLDFGATSRLVPFLARRVRRGERVLELGCGTGLLSIGLARLERRVVGVDVSEVALNIASERSGGLEGLEFQKVVGVKLTFPDDAFDLAFSVEVIEHLHPDDVASHFAEVLRVLRPGGRYVFWTPNARTTLSPAQRFGLEGQPDQAEGDVHLKEWTYRELFRMLGDAGFVRRMAPWHHGYPRLPMIPMHACIMGEALVGRPRARRIVTRLLPLVGQCAVAAAKPRST